MSSRRLYLQSPSELVTLLECRKTDKNIHLFVSVSCKHLIFYQFISNFVQAWSPQLDFMLLKGVLKHGHGNWIEIAGDKALELTESILDELGCEIPNTGSIFSFWAIFIYRFYTNSKFSIPSIVITTL